ncbi:hypothetical protein EVAR_44296_1 [Eumeta japonica]|uniref:Uncharacterized protein n=1 Tax=Eumeta variegata TaxID=151549 RepID=A0A4C1WT77_EUMVA|nr:hypothetical protein EVAR_44296_1 [Eumeta japonica]
MSMDGADHLVPGDSHARRPLEGDIERIKVNVALRAVTSDIKDSRRALTPSRKPNNDRRHRKTDGLTYYPKYRTSGSQLSHLKALVDSRVTVRKVFFWCKDDVFSNQFTTVLIRLIKETSFSPRLRLCGNEMNSFAFRIDRPRCQP